MAGRAGDPDVAAEAGFRAAIGRCRGRPCRRRPGAPQAAGSRGSEQGGGTAGVASSRSSWRAPPMGRWRCLQRTGAPRRGWTARGGYTGGLPKQRRFSWPPRPRTRVLTGITTSGTPHLGNYVGAIRPAIAASHRADIESFYFLADYHALIKVQEPARVQRSTLEIAAAGSPAGSDPDEGVVLPPVRHPRDPRTDLAADLRRRQGPAQPRACLQGGGRQEPRRASGRRCGHHRRPVHVPGADGRRHPDVQGAQGAGGPRPGAAHRDGARLRPALQPSVRRALRAARSGDRRTRGDAARPRRPQDEQELRQHHPAVRAARAVEEADLRDRDRFARAGRAEGHAGFGAVPALPGVRVRRRSRRDAQGLRRWHRLGRCEAAAVRAHRSRGRADAREVRNADGRAGEDRSAVARRCAAPARASTRRR